MGKTKDRESWHIAVHEGTEVTSAVTEQQQ